MLSGMKIKTSVTLDEQVVKAIDKMATGGMSRSQILEDAAKIYLAARARMAREQRDRRILDEAADALNREMEDVLTYQGDV